MRTDKDELMHFLSNKINGKRFEHSVNTAKEAVALSSIYGADKEKAYIAGLLHDVAKGLPPDVLKNIAVNNNITVDKYENDNPELLHGKISAVIVSRELGITDEDILCAIRWHTTGRAGMSLLEKIIYLADVIEPSREFKEIKRLRETAYKDIDAAMVMGLADAIKYVKSRGFTLHPRSIEAYNDLKKREEK